MTALKSNVYKILFLSSLLWVNILGGCEHKDEERIMEYKVEREVYADNLETQIFYPKIIGLNSFDIEGKVNQLIEEEIIKHCDDDGINSFEVDFEIKYMGYDYISILFQGTRTPQGGPHSVDIAWGVTVDLSTRELVSITNFIEDNELQQKIMNEEYFTERGMDTNTYEEVMGETDWYQKYQECSLDYQDENHNNDFYITDRNIGILFGVSHAIGDYIIIEIGK